MAESSKPWLVRRSRRRVESRQTLRDLVDVTVDGVVVPVFVILWETDNGPVLFFEPLRAESTVNDGPVVRQLCRQLLGPEPWEDATLLTSFPVALDMLAFEKGAGPHIRVHPARFETGYDGQERLERGTRHLAGEVGRALGADLPIWVRGSNTVEIALAEPGRTIVVPDNTTWHKSETILLRALDAGMPESYPLGWAALAAEHAIKLNSIRAGHARLPDRGPGWHLVARPRLPQPPERLARLLDDVSVPTERGEPVALEVMGLEADAGVMDRDDERIGAYTQAADLLWRLTSQEFRDRVRASRPVTATATWAGPVVETWRQSLTPASDLRPHRIARLLKDTPLAEVREAYQDRDGRHVLVLAGEPPQMRAEWQRGPAVWADSTVLAMDRPDGPLLALTPQEDGSVRADMVPGRLLDGGPLTFEPAGVMRMLLALDPATAEFTSRSFIFELLTEHPGMKLWAALTGDSVRLRWPDLQSFVAADLAHVRRLLTSYPPPYQYFGIVNTIGSQEPYQVVRRTTTVDGVNRDESINPDGSWTSTTLLHRILFGRDDDDCIRLTPREADQQVGLLLERWANRRG